MAYSDFTLEMVNRLLGVATVGEKLVASAQPPPVPAWLVETLERGTQLATLSEKSRSEFIVAPILLASRDLSPVPLAIFSGQRLDVDPSRGLVGECDFILALAPSVPPLRAPIAVIVEAKKNDIESGLGQCIAQMTAAALFNAAAGESGPIHGCVTTGEVWQFLRLVETTAQIDQRRYYLDDLPGILAAIQTMITATGVVSIPVLPGTIPDAG